MWMRIICLAVLTAQAQSGGEDSARLSGRVLCTKKMSTDNVVVYLTGTNVPAPVPPAEPVVVDQKNLRFIPHVLAIVAGTAVKFPNSDQVRHNVFSASDAQMFNLGTYGFGDSRKVSFTRPGVVELLCNVHPEMSAYIIVLDTPYFAKTRADGSFEIGGVAPGDYTLRFWCKHQGVISKDITLHSRRTTAVAAILHDKDIETNPARKTFRNSPPESIPAIFNLFNDGVQ